MALHLDDLEHRRDPQLDPAENVDSLVARSRRHLHVLVAHLLEQLPDQVLESVGVDLGQQLADGFADPLLLVAQQLPQGLVGILLGSRRVADSDAPEVVESGLGDGVGAPGSFHQAAVDQVAQARPQALLDGRVGTMATLRQGEAALGIDFEQLVSVDERPMTVGSADARGGRGRPPRRPARCRCARARAGTSARPSASPSCLAISPQGVLRESPRSGLEAPVASPVSLPAQAPAAQEVEVIVDARLNRIAEGGGPRVLDLFSGCGGLSVGFQRAGFEIIGGVEKDWRAAWAYAVNIHRTESEDRRTQLGRSRDICATRPGKLLKELGYSDPARAVDVLVGGPPCQAYARIGRAKLRALRDDPEAFRQDERGELYRQYLSYVRTLRPLALLVENVPDILSYGGRNVAREIASQLRALGYLVNFDLVNAAAYGVPQNRRRFYLVAFRQELARHPTLPAPTHRIIDLPTGYREFSALVATLRASDPSCYGPPAAELAEEEAARLPAAVTVMEAIGDLPRLTAHLEGRMRGGRRKFDTCLPYAGPPLSDFARDMRAGWPGLQGEDGIWDQTIRLLPRDYRIFAQMKPGDDYPQAHAIALGLFHEELARQRATGKSLRTRSVAWKALRRKFVPPYDPGKFPNKWWKMHPDTPARTLMAHLSHDSYSHIHYDDSQARTISVREAARLQSFPDGFRFYEAMNPAFGMIGNAVPPLIAFRLAQHLLAELRDAARSRRPYALTSSKSRLVQPRKVRKLRNLGIAAILP